MNRSKNIEPSIHTIIFQSFYIEIINLGFFSTFKSLTSIQSAYNCVFYIDLNSSQVQLLINCVPSSPHPGLELGDGAWYEITSHCARMLKTTNWNLHNSDKVFQILIKRQLQKMVWGFIFMGTLL